MKISKQYIYIFSLAFIAMATAFLIGKASTAEAKSCAWNECADNEYECQGGKMCCTGGGCPSWVCTKSGGKWQGNTCAYCTPITKRTCVAYETYIKSWKYKCSRYCGAQDTREVLGISDATEDSSGLISRIPEECGCNWYPVYGRRCSEYKTEVIGQNCRYESPDPNDTCRWCTGEEVEPPVPPCTTTPVTGKPGLTSPENNTDFEYTITSVPLTWTDPTTWGKCCGSCGNKFEIWVKTNTGAYQKKATVLGTVHTYNLAVSAGNSYSWYVIAINGDAAGATSVARHFEVLPEPPDVTGYIWDATDKACNSGKAANEIQADDLDGSVSVSLAGDAGVWDPATFDSFSYRVSDTIDGNNQTLCASMPAPKDMPNFKYNLSCLNNNSSGIISGSCATINVSGDTTAHLGFELSSKGWFHVSEGDVYGGCDDCIDSVSIGIPDATQGGFENYLIESPGTVFGNSDLSVKNSTGADRYISDGNEYFSKNMQSNFWPKTFSFNAPSSAETISGGNCSNILNSGNLVAGESYSLSRSCMQSAIDNLNANYRINGDGVVVLYVEGDGVDLLLDKNFRSQNQNTRRLVIVTTASIEIDDSIGDASPTPSTRPNIEASIVTEGSVTFLSNGTNNDTTVILEGPLVTKNGSISFNRDRGLENGFPAEYIRYNPIYLTAFDEETNTGLGVVDIIWTLQ